MKKKLDCISMEKRCVDQNLCPVCWRRKRKTDCWDWRLGVKARVLAFQHQLAREIARQLQITTQSVKKSRKRLRKLSLEGFFDEPRPGTPRTIPGEQVERVIAKKLHGTPRGAT